MQRKIILLMLMVSFQAMVCAESSHFNKFIFIKPNKRSFSMSFKLISNQIIIPLQINDSPTLNFILDSGVSTTLFTNIPTSNPISFKDAEKVTVNGLGISDNKVIAYFSKGNTSRISKHIENKNFKIIVIADKLLELSQRIGIDVHGIIGHDLLKDFVVHINYQRSRITFYNPAYFREKRFRNYKKIPLSFKKKKPYVLGQAMMKKDEPSIFVKMLIDTGGSDALWLFENSKPEIQIHNHFLDDYLGWGLNGEIYGKRSRISQFTLGGHSIDAPTASFPDSLSTRVVRFHKQRNGSIGGDILRRFSIVFNYQEKYMLIKPNHSIDDPFHYNMSGMELRPITHLLPIYEVFSIRKKSPAYRSGIRIGDIIESINDVRITHKNVNRYISLFRYKPEKRFIVTYLRNGKKHKTRFELQKVL